MTHEKVGWSKIYLRPLYLLPFSHVSLMMAILESGTLKLNVQYRLPTVIYIILSAFQREDFYFRRGRK
jgi:hypothetical protein